MSRLIQLLDRPIAYQPAFADLRVGKVKSGPVAAVFLSQLVYWYNRMDSEWLYKTQADITKETKLTRDEQETARKRLIALGVIDEARRGVPGKMHFRINVERLEALLMGEPIEKENNEESPQTEKGDDHNVEPPQSTVVDSHNVETPHCGDTANNNVETPQSTMVQPTEQECGNPALFPTGDYTEITSESTSKEKPPLTPPVVDKPVADKNQTAGEVLDFLNSKTNTRTPRRVDTLREITERLAEGYTPEELNLVAEYRISELSGKPELGHMRNAKFIFGATVFSGYLSGARDWDRQRSRKVEMAAAVEQQRQTPPTGDVPEIDFDGSFERLFVEGLPPESQAEKLAWQHVQARGFSSPDDEIASRKEWRVILSKKNAIAGRAEA